MTYENLIKENPELALEEPEFEDGMLWCPNCVGNPASVSWSQMLGRISCSICATGAFETFDPTDIITEFDVFDDSDSSH